MSTFVKKYPRARIAPHPTLNGWTIDLLMGPNGRPSRVKATYASIPFALKAAHAKLGVGETLSPEPTAEPAPAPQPTPQPEKTTDAGTCGTCNRPMRKQGTKASDHPGTVARRREGCCQSCALRAEREQGTAA